MPEKTNLVWIMADQLRADMIGCNGDPNVHTPHIDALAKDGVNFYRALSTDPLCCPARGSMLTSMYPNKCALGHEYRMPTNEKTIAQALNEKGYHTAYVGKWHLDGWHEKVSRAAFHIVPQDRRGGFAYWLGYENNNSQYDCYVHGGWTGQEDQKPTKLEGYETDCMTNLFVEHLKSMEKDKPFFAVMSVQPPHDPYVAPQRNLHYQPEKLRLRPNTMPDLEPYKQFNDSIRQGLANAYAMIENFDENVGRIVAFLKETGLYEHTIIMVFSDHGDTHGSHGQQRKTNPMEESIRVPFIIGGKKLALDPTLIGARIPYLLSSVDIAPTSLGLLGLASPHAWKGCDYSVACKRKTTDFSYPTSAYIQNIIPEHHPHSVELPWRGVVTTDGWKYVCLEGKPWMLFNLREDPYELRNLAFCGIAKEERMRLQLMLKDWIERTEDVFELPLIDAKNDLIEHARETFGYPEYPDD